MAFYASALQQVKQSGEVTTSDSVLTFDSCQWSVIFESKLTSGSTDRRRIGHRLLVQGAN